MPFITSTIAAIGSAVSAVTAFTAGLGVIGKAVLGFGLSMGLSALSGALGGSKKQAAVPGEISATLQVGGDIPRQVAFGRVALRGQLGFAATTGVANERLCQLFILSDGWCDAIEAVWFGDVRHTLEPLTPDENAVAKYWLTAYGDTGFGDKRATIWFYDGRPGQGAPQRPRLFAPDRVEVTDRWAGQCVVVVELINNNDTFDSIPDMLWELRGYRCHDPRKDVAFGGSGSHSLGDPSTWEWTENPALQVLAYLRGIQCEGQVFMGLELADYDVLTETFAQAANIADEPVPLDAGGSEPRYRASVVLTAQDGDHRAALAPLVQAQAGYLIERNGSFGLLAGAAQLPVVTVTDADIDWTRGVTWSGSKSRTARVNEVHGQFVDPSAQWQANSYPPITSGTYSAEDGERLAVQLDFGAITSITQAQRAARIRMRETRWQASGSITLGFHMLWVEPGDWIGWESDTFAFDRIYRVVSRDLNPDDTVSLQLQEVGNNIYSWNTADEQPYAPIPGPSTEPPLPTTVEDFAVQADVITGADGSTRPILRLSWEPITDTRVIAVIIEYRPIGTIAATRVRDDSPYDGEFILDQPPTGLDYEFRASIATIPARPVTWTPWVSLSALRSARWRVDLADITNRFRAEVKWQPLLLPDLSTALWNTAQSAQSANGLAKASIRRAEQVSVTESEARALLAEEVSARFVLNEASILTVSEATATNTSAVATLTTVVSAKANQSDLNAVSATVTTQGAAIATNTGALASLTTVVSAKADSSTVSTLSATVTTQGTAIINLGTNKADASYVVAVEAKANAATAGGIFEITAETGPDGANAQLRERVFSTVAGTLIDAGRLTRIAGGVASQFYFAHRFYFVDTSGGNEFIPFGYEGGQWVMSTDLVFRSGASGERVVVNSNGVLVYDASDVLRVRLGRWS